MVIPVLNPHIAEELITLGAALAGEDRYIRIVVLGVVTVPEHTPLSQGTALVRAYRTMLRDLARTDAHRRLVVTTEVRVAREVWRGIAEQVEDEHADLALLPWKGYAETPGRVYGEVIDHLLSNPPCDIALARLPASMPTLKNILLPVRGGSYSMLALNLATNLANQHGANISVLHDLTRNLISVRNATGSATVASANSEHEVEEEKLGTLQRLLDELPPSIRLITHQSQSPLQTILREAIFHELLIVGASDIQPGSPDAEAPIALQIAQAVANPLLVVKTRHPLEIKPLPLANRDLPPPPHNYGDDVDRWFAENTFNYREFRTMSSLTLLKDRNKQTVSLIIPVSEKVGPLRLADLVRKAHLALMSELPLIDEIIVSDPLGRLDQEDIALLYSSLAIETSDRLASDQVVYYVPQWRPLHTPNGKLDLAEALWHALHRVRGSLVVWLDPLCADFEPRLVYGLLGPLLNYPVMALSVGFFDEGENNHLKPETRLQRELIDLTLRPLLGGFFPKLMGALNPLSGIGAARRDLLVTRRLVTGSAYLTGLLIDTCERNDLMSIAQVELGAEPEYIEGRSLDTVANDLIALLLERTSPYNSDTLSQMFNPTMRKVQQVNGVYSLVALPEATPRRILEPVLDSPDYEEFYNTNRFEI